MSGNNRQRRAKRNRIARRDGWVCWLCGYIAYPAEVTNDPQGPFVASLDHVIPLDQDGTNDDDNIRIAHRHCNSARGNSDYLHQSGMGTQAYRPGV